MKRVNRLGLKGFQSVEAISGLGLGNPYPLVRNKMNNEETNINRLISYRWCDSSGNSFSGGALRYGNTDNVFLIINFKNISKKDYCKIDIINVKNNLSIQTETILVNKEVHLVKVNVKKIYDNCDELLSTFKVKLKYNNEHYKHANDLFLKNLEELKIHFVIFIPEVLDKLKWIHAAKAQRDWFNNIGNNYPWESAPRLNYYEFDWALGFERFKSHFEKHYQSYKSEESVNQLKEEIKKMVKEKYIVLPDASNIETSFGIFENDTKLVETKIYPKELNKRETHCLVPLFDKFYYSSLKLYEESIINPELDDLYGAIANTSIRIVASGILKFENNKVNVFVNRIGFYIKDGFDFVGDQFFGLGNWSKNGVSTKKLKNVSIDNKSYRNYRKDTGMGQDFYAYSTVKYYKLNNFRFAL